MLGQVHGHPQLRLLQAQDIRAHWGHHYGSEDSVSAGLRAEQHRVSHHRGCYGRAEGTEPLRTIGFDHPKHAPLIWHLQSGRGCQGHVDRCRRL
jgi:hypothetical protein